MKRLEPKTNKARGSNTGGLILSRKENESLVIYDPNDGAFVPITITQSKISGNRSRLHIAASRHLSIVRGELAEGSRQLAEGEVSA